MGRTKTVSSFTNFLSLDRSLLKKAEALACKPKQTATKSKKIYSRRENSEVEITNWTVTKDWAKMAENDFEPISSYEYTKIITILQNNHLMKKDQDLPEESTMKNKEKPQLDG